MSLYTGQNGEKIKRLKKTVYGGSKPEITSCFVINQGCVRNRACRQWKDHLRGRREKER